MKALVVDDNEDMRIMVEYLLRDHGFNTILQASNGKEALRILEESPFVFSLLLTDFNMPVMNGKELIEASFKKGIEIKKIVVMSGMTGNEELISDIMKDHPNVKFVHKLGSLVNFIAAVIN